MRFLAAICAGLTLLSPQVGIAKEDAAKDVLAPIKKAVTESLAKLESGDEQAALGLLESAVAGLRVRKAEALYSKVLEDRKRSRSKWYTVEMTVRLERVVALNPDHAAGHVLAWTYATSPDFKDDRAAHERALVYATRYFVLHARDIYRLQILGATMYANGNVRAGDAYFAAYIKSLPEDRREAARKQRTEIRELHN